MIGHPAARADAASVPIVEYASGKLLAPKTATGPRGKSNFRKPGLGLGLRPGFARSIAGLRHDPSSTVAAKVRRVEVVRSSSLDRRSSGSPVS